MYVTFKKNIRKKRYSSSGGGIINDMTTLVRYGGYKVQNWIDGFNGAETTKPSPYPSVQNKLHLKNNII